MSSELSLVIPTYRREAVLVDTVRRCLALCPAPAEVLVVDQTPNHEPETERALSAWLDTGHIRWIRLKTPSITHAMNQGLLLAKMPYVLFVDDDVIPEPDLLSAHLAAISGYDDVLVAGRVIQPWQEGQIPPSPNAPFSFFSTQQSWCTQFMGGNFCVPRRTAMDLGGFDENFVSVAYNFEAEFSHRWRLSGRRIRFEPSACLHHLKAGAGGTRAYGEHLITTQPHHAVGAYYFLLKTGRLRGIIRRLARAPATRFHLRHPWRIPGTLLAELRGLLWAWRLHRKGPKYVNIATAHG
jgi:GT2 family glycosyltransferase